MFKMVDLHVFLFRESIVYNFCIKTRQELPATAAAKPNHPNPLTQAPGTNRLRREQASYPASDLRPVHGGSGGGGGSMVPHGHPSSCVR